MGKSWPSQRAQPIGAKFPEKILISATNGFAMYSSLFGLILTGEYPLQGNDEVQHQIGRHVLMRLAAARGQNAGRVHCGIRRGGKRIGAVSAPQITRGCGDSSLVIGSHWNMVVSRQLRDV